MFIAILALIARLSLIAVLPIAIIIVWQKRTNAHWSSLLLCLLAFSVNYLAQLTLGETVFELSYHEAFVPVLVFFASISGALIFFPWVLDALIFGLIREGGRWLILRYATKKVRLWQDGVLFGIGYSFLALLFMVGDHLFTWTPDLSQHPPVEKLIHFSYFFNWWTTFYFSWRWVVELLGFNVCTSLAVLASVQRRKLRYLLIAVAIYVVYVYAPGLVGQILSDRGLYRDVTDPLLKQFAIEELWRLPFAFLFLWLAFHLRKYYLDRINGRP